MNREFRNAMLDIRNGFPEPERKHESGQGVENQGKPEAEREIAADDRKAGAENPADTKCVGLVQRY
ncbi:hypothetical protein NKH16_04070 [Mesorhizobium sp. M1307]|uniref:hypothetical protein n=1 Tax=unclassified Mesorhizobium TaxID=325217 RepID=UPI00333DBD0E